MKRAIYTLLYIAGFISICVGFAFVEGVTIHETMIGDGIFTVIAIAMYRDFFNEFKR